jgi:Zn-dependent protease
MLLKLLFDDTFTFILLVIPLIYSIVIHELAHGWAAYIMGDTTAKNMGRLTLNPLSHLDPFGTLALFIVGFGWAKPVPVNTYALRNGRSGFIFVALAGIIANIIFAFLALLAFRILSPSPGMPVATFLFYLAQINIMLAAFNLIPIPPLDGSRVLTAFLPPHMQYQFRRIEPYGFFIIIALAFTGLLRPVTAAIMSIIIMVISLLL